VADLLNAIENARLNWQKIASAPAQPNVKASADAKANAAALEAKFAALEDALVNAKITGRGQDEVRYPVRLGGQLMYLGGQIAGSDFAPTSQQREVAQWLKQQVQNVKQQVDALMKNQPVMP
jgi:hypothetical protein